MAVEKIIKLVTELDDKGIKELDKDIKQAEESSKDLEKQNKKTSKSFKRVGQAVKVVGTALKAAGIGLVIALFAKLGDVVGKNQKVLDVFSNVSTSLSIAFNDLFSIFENGLPSLQEIGESIKNNIIERFQSALETTRFLSAAVVKFFKGDFSGALESAKEAGKEFIDVVTGVDGSLDKVTKYTEKIWEQAEATTALANASKIAEAQNRRLFEQYDRDAEIQRRIRDDFEKTAQERLDANEKLKEILEEQEKAQLRLGRITVASARAEIAATGENVENKVALINALAELDAIEADIAGRRAEQEAQDRALRKELLEERKAEIGSILQLEGEAKIQNAITTAEQIEKIDTGIYVNREKISEEDRRREDALADYKVQTAGNVLNALAGIAEEGSAGAKGIAIAQAVLSTYQGINKALAETTDFTPSQTLRFANAAAVGIAGFANVAKILSTDSSGKSKPNFAGASGGGGGASAPSFNVVGTSGVNQLAESLQQDQQPIQAYVVGSNVTSQQELDRNIVDTVSLG